MKGVITGILVACAVFANESERCFDCPAVREKNVLGRIQGSLASTRAAEHGLFFEAEFLYWLPQQEGLEYAFSQNSPSLTPSGVDLTPADFATIQNGRFERIDFQWEPGVCLKAGYRLPIDDWDLYLRWTRLDADATDIVQIGNIDTQNIAAIWLEAEFSENGYLRATAAQSCWNMSYNVLDLAIARSYFSSPQIALTPNVGIRGFWVNQKFRADYSGGDLTLPAYFKGKNNYDGAALFGELGMQWSFLQNWSLIGDFLGAFNFGRLKIEQQIVSQIDLPPEGATSLQSPSAITVPRDNNPNESTHPVLFCYQAAIGLQWQKFFRACFKRKVTVAVLYELIEWLHINQMRRYSYSDFPSVTNYFPMNGNLGFQGVSVRARFDF